MDDDLLNLILGNNTNDPSATQFANNLGQGADAGSPPLSSLFSTGLGGDVIASMLPQLGDTGAPSASLSPSLQPPSSLAGTPTGNAPLSSLFSTGLGGDVIASMLPRRQVASAALPPAGTSAAFLSPSSLQPPPALYDPNPPAPTVEQLAVMLGVSPQGVASIRDQAENQVRMADIADDLAAPVIEKAVSEVGILGTGVAVGKNILSGGKLVGGAMDVLNNQAALTASQREAAAGDQAIFQRLNDTLAQPYSSPNMPPAWRAFPW